MSNHPFALLLQGPTKYLLVLWTVLDCLFFIIALEANGVLHISPGGFATSFVGLLFVVFIWMAVSYALVMRWITSRFSRAESVLK